MWLNFRNWINASLANSFAVRAVLVALTSSLAVAAISVGVVHWTEQQAMQFGLSEKASRVRERLESAIQVMENAVDDLARSSMLMTALLDSTGRDAYVVPFLASYRFPLAAKSGLMLCDLNGQRLAGTSQSESACPAGAMQFKRVVAGEKLARELIVQEDGRPVWVVYRGVEFTYTGTIEGVVVSTLDLSDILQPTLQDFDLLEVVLMRRGEAVPLAHIGVPAPQGGEGRVWAKAALFSEKTEGGMPGLDLEVFRLDTPILVHLKLLFVFYGLGLLIIVGAVVFWTRRFSRAIVAPLQQLTATAEKIANTGDLSLPIPRATLGEVGSMASAFAIMVDTLKASEAQLEKRVADRTADLRRSEAAAEAANVAKSRFLATMSHEIRTPMNGILGMAQMLLMPGLKDDERSDFARTILNSGQTLLKLLNDILDLSKVESGKMDLEMGVVDPEELIRDVSTLFSEAAHQKGLSLNASWQGQAGRRYRGDAHRLRQMLSNLVSNALKFTTRGEVVIQGKVLASADGEAVIEFSVTDSGIGIPKDKHALLFLPFSQVDSTNTRQYGGSGLGLSIVRTLASLMGGEVGCDSDLGSGSRFWFSVRLAEIVPNVDTRSAARGDVSEPLQAAMPGQASHHVLVAEDNPTNTKVLRIILDRIGLRSSFVENGEAAVQALQSGEAFDLVLMDVQMPVMDGYVATRQIRAWEQESGRVRTPIVALTADAFEEDRQKCLAVGMDDFLAKPVDVGVLRKVLAHWLGQKVPA